MAKVNFIRKHSWSENEEGVVPESGRGSFDFYVLRFAGGLQQTRVVDDKLEREPQKIGGFST